MIESVIVKGESEKARRRRREFWDLEECSSKSVTAESVTEESGNLRLTEDTIAQ